MTPHTSRKGSRRYHYYVCQTAQKQGASACPGSRVGAGELEVFVLDRIRHIGRDPKLLEATLEADRRQQELGRPELVAESRRLGTERTRLDGERSALVDAIAKGGKAAPTLAQRLGERDEELRGVERREAEVRAELAALETGSIDPDELRQALADLGPVWAELFPQERVRVLALLIERVEFDAEEALGIGQARHHAVEQVEEAGQHDQPARIVVAAIVDLGNGHIAAEEVHQREERRHSSPGDLTPRPFMRQAIGPEPLTELPLFALGASPSERAA